MVYFQASTVIQHSFTLHTYALGAYYVVDALLMGEGMAEGKTDKDIAVMEKTVRVSKEKTFHTRLLLGK